MRTCARGQGRRSEGPVISCGAGSENKAHQRFRTTARAAGLVAVLAAVIIAANIAPGTQLGTTPIAGARPTATVSGAADPNAKYAWYEKLGDPYQAMDDSLKAFAAALGNGDFPRLQAACRRIRAAGQKFQAMLPGPDRRANFRIQDVADDLALAADSCAALPPGAGWDTSKEMLSHVDDANANLRAAKQILAPYG
jgi:hypothetical protein